MGITGSERGWGDRGPDRLSSSEKLKKSDEEMSIPHQVRTVQATRSLEFYRIHILFMFATLRVFFFF
jgi:hypothetical protein